MHHFPRLRFIECDPFYGYILTVMNKETGLKLFPHAVNNVFDASDRSLLILEGDEGKDFLQRLSTNDLSKLEIGGNAQTILANEKGRIVEVLSVIMIRKDRLVLVGQSRDTERLRTWLDKFIIMEDAKTRLPDNEWKHFIFFQDEISMKLGEKRSRSMPLTWSDDLKNTLKIPKDALLFQEQLGDTNLLHLLLDRTQEKELVPQEQDPDLSKMEFERFRVVHGIPVSPNELSELYNPLEANLGSLVNWTKGCYIGQEVIARLDTYKKIQKHLIHVKIGRLPATVPVKLSNERGEAGILTSAVSLENGTAVGLAYVGSAITPESELWFENDGRKVAVERSRS